MSTTTSPVHHHHHRRRWHTHMLSQKNKGRFTGPVVELTTTSGRALSSSSTRILDRQGAPFLFPRRTGGGGGGGGEESKYCGGHRLKFRAACVRRPQYSELVSRRMVSMVRTIVAYPPILLPGFSLRLSGPFSPSPVSSVAHPSVTACHSRGPPGRVGIPSHLPKRVSGAPHPTLRSPLRHRPITSLYHCMYDHHIPSFEVRLITSTLPLPVRVGEGTQAAPGGLSMIQPANRSSFSAGRPLSLSLSSALSCLKSLRDLPWDVERPRRLGWRPRRH